MLFDESNLVICKYANNKRLLNFERLTGERFIPTVYSSFSTTEQISLRWGNLIMSVNDLWTYLRMIEAARRALAELLKVRHNLFLLELTAKH